MGAPSVVDTGTDQVVVPAVEVGGATVVELHGDIDTELMEALRDCVAFGVERDADVLIDLADVTLIDCAALNSLVQADRLAGRRGRRVCLVAPPRMVRRILAAVGLDTAFPVVDERRQQALV